MTSIRNTLAERNPRQVATHNLIAGFFTPIKNSLHDGNTVFCGSGYGVEERNKSLISSNTYPEQHDRRKPADVFLIEALAASPKSGFIRNTLETDMSNQPLTVNFHGASLNILEHNNQPYVSAKQINDAIGLDWAGQYSKLNKNRARWGIEKISIPSTSGKQSTICIPLRKLPGWLAGIQPNKVSNALRPTIIQYQNECDDALWAHWEQKTHGATPAQRIETSGTILPDLQNNTALALSPTDSGSVDPTTLRDLASFIAGHQRSGEPVTITVLLAKDRSPVVKAMSGKQTVFPNDNVRAFMAHYDKATELSISNTSACNTFLLSGSSANPAEFEQELRKLSVEEIQL